MKDAAVVRYVTTLGNQLAQATDSRGLTWYFTVVDSKEINAFALPSGWVYVNRGLIERSTNMSELAGVLAHEIGHITRRHSVQQMQQGQGANVGLSLLCTLTNVCESGATPAAINVGGSSDGSADREVPGRDHSATHQGRQRLPDLSSPAVVAPAVTCIEGRLIPGRRSQGPLTGGASCCSRRFEWVNAGDGSGRYSNLPPLAHPPLRPNRCCSP